MFINIIIIIPGPMTILCVCAIPKDNNNNVTFKLLVIERISPEFSRQKKVEAKLNCYLVRLLVRIQVCRGASAQKNDQKSERWHNTCVISDE